jgi:O-glycosyl hydrolase
MEPILPSIIMVSAIAALSSDKVEKAYWNCESAAIQGTIAPDDRLCIAIYEHLKNDKFRGDFDRFLAWWRQHKDRELSSRIRPR